MPVDQLTLINGPGSTRQTVLGGLLYAPAVARCVILLFGLMRADIAAAGPCW
jgi:hypothetical protein